MVMDLNNSGLVALEKLRKVLELEERRGFSDQSVGNGVAKFAGERIARLLPALDPESGRVLREIDGLLADYGQMSPENRERCAREASRLLNGVLSTAKLHQRAAPAESPTSPKPARRNTSSKARTRRTASLSTLDDSVSRLPGVGPARVKQLEQLGVRTVRDLLELYPRRYLDYSRLDPISSLVFGAISTVRGTVESIDARPTRTGKKLVDVVVADDTGSIHAVFFSPYIEQQLRPGMEISLSGRVDQLRGRLCFKSPEWEALTPESVHTGRIVPVYPLTKGLYQKTMRNLVRSALDAGLDLVEEHLPHSTLERVSNPPLIPLRDALAWIHYPEGETIDEARRRWKLAKSRIAFDEFFGLQLGLLQKKQDIQSQPGTAIPVDRELLSTFLQALPFELTGAQDRTLNEILQDMESERPMTRLLQGDVGSGKTAVAAAAGFLAIQAGFQVAVMAPTELLAEQHERSFNALFDALPAGVRPRVGLITGSATAAARRDLYRSIESGYFDLVVGTHALIQEGVMFDRLGLVIVDEQHRFGVEQRGALRAKGREPDVLVMTATPIPRSLALTLHGDLDVSTIDELPPGRQPITTRWMRGRERRRAYEFVREQVQAGYQTFIVFPLVEESEAVDARAAVEE
ncbi:MAG: DEAD/DEAH box helicase, partial [Chloroflexota bacterium]